MVISGINYVDDGKQLLLLMPKTVTKVSREFDSCRTHFLCGKKKKEEASPQGKNRAMWGEEAKPLKHKNDAERKSDL